MCEHPEISSAFRQSVVKASEAPSVTGRLRVCVTAIKSMRALASRFFWRLRPVSAICSTALVCLVFGSGHEAYPQQQSSKPVASVPITIAPFKCFPWEPYLCPPSFSKKLRSAMTEIAKRRSIRVVEGTGAVYALRGFFLLSLEENRTNLKLSCVWDITDKEGKRVDRFLAEELVDNTGPKPSILDSRMIDDAAIEKIAEGVSDHLAVWLSGAGAAKQK